MTLIENTLPVWCGLSFLVLIISILDRFIRTKSVCIVLVLKDKKSSGDCLHNDVNIFTLKMNKIVIFMCIPPKLKFLR